MSATEIFREFYSKSSIFTYLSSAVLTQSILQELAISFVRSVERQIGKHSNASNCKFSPKKQNESGKKENPFRSKRSNDVMLCSESNNRIYVLGGRRCCDRASNKWSDERRRSSSRRIQRMDNAIPRWDYSQAIHI